MNQKMIATALLIVNTLAIATSIAAEQPGASPKTPVTPGTATPAAPAGDKVSQLREWLALPTDKLVATAQQQGFEALSELRAGRDVARFESREKNLEQFRIDLLAQAEVADRRRAELLKRVEQEVEQIREQFAEDQAECANQIRIVIQQHRDAITKLKVGAEGCRQLAKQTDSQLKVVRPKLLALRRDQRVTAEGQFAASQPAFTSATSVVFDTPLIAMLTSDLQSLALEEGVTGDEPATPRFAATGSPPEKANITVEQVMAELDSLKQ